MTNPKTQVETVEDSEFLPAGYTVPDKNRQFMKLQNGDNVIRVLTTPTLGWEIFTEDNKPIRKQFINGNNNFTSEELEEYDAKRDERTGKIIPPKHFWILLVWDFSTNSPKVLEVTQITVIRKLHAYLKEEDWGDLRGYNINITRTGTGKNDTEYDVIAKPHKDLPEDVKKVVEELKEKNLVNLDAIWNGDYPFEIYNW